VATQQASVETSGRPGEGATRFAPLRRADEFDRDVWSLLGVPVDAVDAQGAVAAIERAARDGERLSLITPNVNFLVRAAKDADERRRMIDADLSFVDGAPLVVIGRLLGMRGLRRCAGSDIFDALRRRPAFAGRRIRVFFFGGRDGAAEAAAAELARENRGLEAAGALNPGFGELASLSADGVIDAINAARPDFLVVALGASKGQAWIDANLPRLDAPVIAHLGAVVDFTAGTIARAPAIFRKTGFEWAWRIAAEPALWRRYWNDALALAGLAVTRLRPALAPQRRQQRPAAADLAAEGRSIRIRLAGDLCAGDLAPVRTAFRAASKGPGDVILDFSDAGAVDAAFLGLVLVLEKALRRRGATIRIAGDASSHRRLLKAHGMTYATAPPARLGAGAAADLGIAAAV
jgi:N-acetylglucosaminyldiphosphoundecaprenol N-acetyl-beta-D-mannosaminyltransferase